MVCKWRSDCTYGYNFASNHLAPTQWNGFTINIRSFEQRMTEVTMCSCQLFTSNSFLCAGVSQPAARVPAHMGAQCLMRGTILHILKWITSH